MIRRALEELQETGNPIKVGVVGAGDFGAAIVCQISQQDDLRAASEVGFRTAFVPRPEEFGRESTPDLTPDPSFDLAAADFNDLASRLGA